MDWARLKRPTRPHRAQGGANHVHEFIVVGGLLQKSACTGLQGAFPVVLRIARGQDDDRDRRQLSALLQAVQHNKAVSRRQADVENDQVGTLFLGHGDGREAVRGIRGIEVVGAQAQV